VAEAGPLRPLLLRQARRQAEAGGVAADELAHVHAQRDGVGNPEGKEPSRTEFVRSVGLAPDQVRDDPLAGIRWLYALPRVR
jgi:hypothetical protein